MREFTDYKLTEHFKLSEFVSEEAWKEVDGKIPATHLQNIHNIAVVLECIRRLMPNHIIRINHSFYGDKGVRRGYRPGKVNVRAGGGASSQHLIGKAADISIYQNGLIDHSAMNYLWTLLDHTWNGGLGKYETFIHIDIREIKARW